jgi:hypothetical protein
MEVEVAYAGYDLIGETIEFEFEWDSVTNFSLEEANPVQIQVAVQEAIYQETGRKEPIGAFVILGGEPYDRIKNHEPS